MEELKSEMKICLGKDFTVDDEEFISKHDIKELVEGFNTVMDGQFNCQDEDNTEEAEERGGLAVLSNILVPQISTAGTLIAFKVDVDLAWISVLKNSISLDHI